MAAIKFDITGDNKNVLDSFNGVQQGVRRMQSTVEKSGQSVESMFQRVTSSALGGITQLAKGIAGLTALMESGSFIKSLYEDMGKFTVAMKEVSTLSEDVTNNLEEYKQRVVELCTQIAIAPEEAAKALYQIESAGHHGADGLNVLEQAAKGAIGGVTETEVAADAITTILNSYKMGAEEAARVNDLLFTTVRLGKTTYGELGRVIAQVTPVAAAYGVAIEDVLAAIASLTKSGTKTSIAVRQVRDAITATTASLGDGTFKTRTFLEAMDEVAEKTKGSESALKSDLSKLSAMNAVLALTGENAASAKQDFIEMQNSTGAATAAYEKMASTAGSATQRLRNNLFAYFMPIGDEIRSMGKSIAESLNEAFDTGSMQTALGVLEAFVASYAVYRTMLAANNVKTGLINQAEMAATNAMYEAEIAQLQTILPLKEAEAKSDIEIAVAEGRLTPEKAALITSLREEAMAHLQNLQAQAAEAQAAFNESTTIAAQTALRLEEAEAAVAAAEMKYQATLRTGNATAIESAELELNTALATKNATAKELQTAREVASAAATKASTTAKIAESAATVIDSTAQKGDAAATGILAVAKLQLKRAIDLVNASFLASPLFWMGAVIVGVTYGIYKLCTAESDAERATRKANEAMEEQNKLNDERRDKVLGLLRTIQDKNQTELAQLAAYNELKTLVPDITDKYTQQALAAMDAAESQKELNGELEEQQYEEAKKKAEEYRKEVERLRKIVGDGTPSLTAMYQSQYTGRNEQITAKRQLPDAEAQLRVWEAAVREYEQLQAEAAENAKPIELRIQQAQENYAVQKEILDFYGQAKDLADNWQLANEQIDFETGETRLEAFIREAESDLENMRQQVEQNPMDVNLNMAYSEKQKILDDLKTMKRNAEEGGFNTMDYWVNVRFSMNYTQFQQQVQLALDRMNNLTSTTVAGGAMSLQAEMDAAKTRFEAAQKALNNITDNASQHTKEELISAQSELKTAKENYEALGGDPEGKLAKKNQQAAKQAANERAQKIKAEQKYQELLRKQMLDRERAARDLELSTAQATIDAMEEGSQKTLAQIALDFEKQKVELQRGYEDLRQKKIDEARRLWEANPANKGKLFDESTVNTEYTEEEQENFRKQQEALQKEYERRLKEQADLDIQAMRDYLQEYGTYQEKKYALAKEYAEKIRKAQSNGERLALQSEYEIKNNEYDTNRLMENIDMASVFGDFGLLLSTPLKETVDQLRKLTQTDAFKNRSFDEQKTVFDAIEKAEKALGGINGLDFRGIGDAMVQYNAALAERVRLEGELASAAKTLSEADEKLIKARQSGDDAAINLAKAEYEEAEAKYNLLKNDYAAASTKVAESQSKASQSLTQFQATLDKVDSSIRAIYNGSLKGIWDLLGNNLQNKIGGLISGGLELQNQFDKMVAALTKSGVGIDAFATNLQSKLGEVFSTFTDETTLEQAKDAVNKMIGKVFEDTFGDDDKFDKVASKVGSLIGDLLESGAKEGTAKDTAQAIGQTIGELLKNVGKAGEASGNLWGVIIGIVLQLLDEFAENGLGRFVEALLKKVGDAVSGILGNIFQDLLPLGRGIGQLVAGIVEGVVNLFSAGAAGSFLTGKDHEEEYNKGLEDWKTSIEANTYAVEQLTKKMSDKTLTPQEAQKERDAALSALQGQIASARGTANYIADDSSSNWFSGYHSWYYKRNDKGFDYNRFNSVLAEHGSNARVNNAQGVVNLSPEDIQILRTYAGQAWADYFGDVGSKQNPNDVKEYLEQIGDLAEKDKEIMDEWYASLTNMTFDSLRDNFKSTLKDMSKDRDDFFDEFEEMMFDALLDEMMSTSGLNAALQEWQKQWGEYIASGNELTKDEVEELRNQYEGLIQQGLDLRDRASAATGYDGGSSAYEQNVSSGGWQSMGQDTADELNGRFTALQMSGEKISEGITSMMATLAALSALADGRNITLVEIRNLMITNNAFLEDILTANKEYYKKFDTKLDKIVTQTK